MPVDLNATSRETFTEKKDEAGFPCRSPMAGVHAKGMVSGSSPSETGITIGRREI